MKLNAYKSLLQGSVQKHTERLLYCSLVASFSAFLYPGLLRNLPRAELLTQVRYRLGISQYRAVGTNCRIRN